MKNNGQSSGHVNSDYPLAVQAFVVLSDDPDQFETTLEKAHELGVNELQLSHSIVMNVDEINQDPKKMDMVENYAELAHEAGLDVYIWAHELNNAGLSVCFNPKDPVWEKRASAYRTALGELPDVDGVVLMFGSSKPDPWYAPCTCDYCEARKNEADDQSLWMFQVPPADERVELITRVVHSVVVGELGLKLIVRTFIHQPQENEWVKDGLLAANNIDFAVMSKDVPQDWEPYYPPHPLFGVYSDRKHLMELDGAGEYCGQTILPFCAVQYFERRFIYGASKGIAGYAARISRGDKTVFGNPNEVNLLAASMFSKNFQVTSEQVWANFISSRYGLDPESNAGIALKQALERTFDIGRKMYYFKGFWALEKGSGLPDTLLKAKLLDERSLAKWDPDYQDWYEEMKNPDVQTLIDLRQEKAEALELSDFSVKDVEQACPKLRPEDCKDLEYRLEHQNLCLKAWTEVGELVWGYSYWQKSKDQAALGWLSDSLSSFESIAGQIESAGFGWPCEPEKIRSLASELRDALGELPPRSKRKQLFISPPTIQVTGNQVVVDFETDSPAMTWIEWGKKVPTYGNDIQISEQAGTSHHVKFNVGSRGWFVLRACAKSEDSKQLVHGSDYWFVVR
ncbi:MAG: hypothetical protein GXP49_14770 [Deltaproteobacteria bacterium]|nr:hypothetical protein [Deltaproteobacteria bacterium]